MELTDLVLAIAHHFAVFLLAATLAGEFVLLRPGLTRSGLALLSSLDRAYGGLAGLIVLIGIGRVLFGLKGWEYYVYYWAFWAKMASFAAVGLLSGPPTARILRWRKQAAAAPDYVVPEAEIAGLRFYVRAEAGFFALILVFAATMARGIGS
jgi:putative membrane protein